jgi:hypothetical protein
VVADVRANFTVDLTGEELRAGREWRAAILNRQVGERR